MRRLIFSIFSLLMISVGAHAHYAVPCDVFASPSAQSVITVLKAGQETGDLTLADLHEFSLSRKWYNPFHRVSLGPETVAFNQIFVRTSLVLSDKDKLNIRSEIAQYVAMKARRNGLVIEAKKETASLMKPELLFQLRLPGVPTEGGLSAVSATRVDGRTVFVGQFKASTDEINRTFIFNPFHRDERRRLTEVHQSNNLVRPFSSYERGGVPYAANLSSNLFVNLRTQKVVSQFDSRSIDIREEQESHWVDINGDLKRFAIVKSEDNSLELLKIDDFNQEIKSEKLAKASFGVSEHRVGSKHYLSSVYEAPLVEGEPRKTLHITLINLNTGKVEKVVPVAIERGTSKEMHDLVLFEDRNRLYMSFRIVEKDKYIVRTIDLSTDKTVDTPSPVGWKFSSRNLVYLDGRPFAYYRTAEDFVIEDLRNHTFETMRILHKTSGETSLFSWKGRRYVIIPDDKEFHIVDLESRLQVSRMTGDVSIGKIFPFVVDGEVYALGYASTAMPYLFKITNEEGTQ